jgi:hypothetical protein
MLKEMTLGQKLFRCPLANPTSCARYQIITIVLHNVFLCVVRFKIPDQTYPISLAQCKLWYQLYLHLASEQTNYDENDGE